MSDFERRTIGSFLKLLVPVVALAIFMAPSATKAEQLLLLHYAGDRHPMPEDVQQIARKPVDIGLNENGDLVMRHRDVMLAMTYSPPNEIIEPRERIRISQRLDCPPISGISLKISFLY